MRSVISSNVKVHTPKKKKKKRIEHLLISTLICLSLEDLWKIYDVLMPSSPQEMLMLLLLLLLLLSHLSRVRLCVTP